MTFRACFMICFLSFLSCQKEDWETIRGTWKLIRHHNLKNGDSNTKPQDLDSDVIITFEDFQRVGRISGRTIKNSLFGDYILFPNQKIEVTKLITSLAYEPEWGQLPGQGLTNALSYTLDRNTLFIHYNDEREALEFKKQ